MASAEETAAIVAAVEGFMRATAAGAPAAGGKVAEWGRVALLEGVERAGEGPSADPWINT